MELFPDGAHVRLRNRWSGAYLYADEDGATVTMSPHRASLNAAWAVHRLVRCGAGYLLLHGAAYGRYLGLALRDETPGQGTDYSCDIVQRVYDSPEQDDVLWVALEAADGSGDVLLRHHTFGMWSLHIHNERRMINWMVEAIPPREEPPELPAPLGIPGALLPPAVPTGGPLRRVRNPAHPQVSRRRIQYVRVMDTVWFYGRSVFDLKRDLAHELGEDESDITLCVQAGSEGRLTPLVSDLPADQETMEIVVFTTDSVACTGLVSGFSSDERCSVDHTDENRADTLA